MMCDGSGELRYGYLCRGCDNCLGLTTPRHDAAPRPDAPRPPHPLSSCPTCGTHCGTRDPWVCNRQAVAS